jgi:hypothetical protein
MDAAQQQKQRLDAVSPLYGEPVICARPGSSGCKLQLRPPSSLALCKVKQTTGSSGAREGPHSTPPVRLHDASLKRRCLSYCNLAVHHVESIHLKSRNIMDGTLYAEGRG